MRRYGPRDGQWDRTKSVAPGREASIGLTARDNWLFVEAVLYHCRAGIPRRMPERFGSPVKVHARFSRWAKNGVRKRVFGLQRWLG